MASQRLEIGRTVISVTYRHTDALGSLIAAMDAAGSVVQTTEHEPYGRMLNRTNDNRPGYTGHVMDQATGLVYMQQRYYDSQLGRFLSVDPITAYSNPVGAFNRYWYANNNPYRFTDPDGRGIKDVWGGFADGMSANFLATPSLIQREPIDLAPQPYGGLQGNSGNFDYIVGRAAANAVTTAIEITAGGLAGLGRSTAGEGGALARSASSDAKGLGNSFKGKSSSEIDRMFTRK